MTVDWAGMLAAVRAWRYREPVGRGVAVLPARPVELVPHGSGRSYEACACAVCGCRLEPTVACDVELLAGMCQSCWRARCDRAHGRTRREA